MSIWSKRFFPFLLFSLAILGPLFVTACHPTFQISINVEPTAKAKDLGKLAYIKGGDIWIKTLPDGLFQRLTDDGNNIDPRWSPSGRWLAFRKGDNQVWQIDASGNLARPLNEGAMVGSFAWSPIKDILAYTTGSSLFKVDADGKNLKSISSLSIIGGAESAEYQIGRIVWQPDGSRIAYEWKGQQNSQPLIDRGIRITSLDGNSPDIIYKGDASLAGWTSDGNYLLFWQGGASSASLTSGGVPLFAWAPGIDTPIKVVDSMLAYRDFVVFDPTGTDQMITVSGNDQQAWTNKMLLLSKASTGEGSPLTTPDLAVSSPAWSPDQSRIAFVGMPDPKSEGTMLQGDAAHQALMQRKIWILDVLEPSKSRQLTTDAAFRDEYPLWSHDGASILFARLDPENRASIWLISTENGGPPFQVADELTPNPGWFGFYGHIEWDSLFDWWCVVPSPPPVGIPNPSPTVTTLPSEPSSITPNTIRTPTSTFSLLPSATPTFNLSPELYPSPRPFLERGNGINAKGCPVLSRVEKASDLPVETALQIINALRSGDLSTFKQASDQSYWPKQTILFPWDAVHSGDVKIYPASQSPYASLIRTGCGQESLDLSWSVQAGEAELAENYFLINRLDHWLVWASYP